jgi:HK97 family phage portal protein
MPSFMPAFLRKNRKQSYTLWKGIGMDYVRTQGYHATCEQGYTQNIIAHRCIKDIASGAAHIPLLLYINDKEMTRHPLLDILTRPNPTLGGMAFFDAVYTQLLVSGNAFIESIVDGDGMPQELWLHRSDRIKVIEGRNGIPKGYLYKDGTSDRFWPVDSLDGHSCMVHLKYYNPLDDWYGLSPLKIAMDAIAQYNASVHWNNAILHNGCRPSGAMIVEGNHPLTETQFQHLKDELEQSYSGAHQAGRPLLLEGGMRWVDMMISPKDMDFLNMRHVAARDIALAFGYPPMLLGINGDNTYNNQKEARLALWEQTILPMVSQTLHSMTMWFSQWYDDAIRLSYDEDAISALNPRREMLWSRINAASFLTDDEKRAAVGYGG